MKKIVRLTESELITVIKNVIKEQKDDDTKKAVTKLVKSIVNIPEVPSDTIVKKVGSDIKIGIEGKVAHIYSLYLPVLGKTEVTMASLNDSVLKIEIAITYGAGNQVEKKLNEKKDEMKNSGITITKKEQGTFSRDRFLFTINLKKNKKVSQGLIDARKGTQYIQLSSDVSLKIA